MTVTTPTDRTLSLLTQVQAAPAHTVAATTADNPTAGWDAAWCTVAEHAMSASATVNPNDVVIGLTDPSNGHATVQTPRHSPREALIGTTQPGGAITWQRYPLADVTLVHVPGPPRMQLWGQQQLKIEDLHPASAPVEANPVTAVASWPTGLVADIAVGAAALGLAVRFRRAFLAKAANSARGWSGVRTIDDPSVLPVFGAAGSRLDAAAAHLAMSTQPGPGLNPADVSLACMDCVDASYSLALSLMPFGGAGALSTSSPMQESLALLAALSTHPLLSRARRLAVTGTAWSHDIEDASDQRSPS